MARTMPYIAGRGANLQLAKSCAGRTYFIRGITFPKTMRNGLFKRDCTGESCCLSFIGQHPINISAGNGDNLWTRQTVIPPQQAYTLYAAANYAFLKANYAIQLKARNKSVRQQARLTKSQNTSLSLQSRPFGHSCGFKDNQNPCASEVRCGICIFTVANKRDSLVKRQIVRL